MWEGAGGPARAGQGVLLAGVIEARCANLALCSGGENLEGFEMGMWFG